MQWPKCRKCNSDNVEAERGAPLRADAVIMSDDVKFVGGSNESGHG